MTPTPSLKSVLCATPSGLHRLAYYEWGERDNPRVLMCVHGLTRCGRDFEPFARAMSSHYRVICPDMPGRGNSDWLVDPMEYQLPIYVADMITLIARLEVESVDWLGTSMGGLIGMALAAFDRSPIRKLVLNDAGPVVTAVSLERIGTYLGRAPALPSFDAAVALVRTIAAPFGPHTDAEWCFLTEVVVRQENDGTWRFHYDPDLARPFNAQLPHRDIVLWAWYDAIGCPTLVMRGARSDLLTRETVEAMKTRGPRARVVEFEGVGHAPTLIHGDQIAVARDFLLCV